MGSVPFQVIPRERAFFDLLERSADGVAAGAEELATMLADMEHARDRNDRIRELERAGDELTHETISLLSTTFVTPVDRQDIHRLASLLDDVLDSQEAVADLLVLHSIEEPLNEVRLQAGVLVRATVAVASGVRSLRRLGSAKPVSSELVRLEREGDRIYRRGVADLFSGDYRAMDVLKWMDILAEMEEAVDRCEDIANTIDSILVKHA